MYWILASERTDENELTIDGIPPIVEALALTFDQGIEITSHVPLIEIPYSLTDEKWKTDNIVVSTRLGLLINETIKSIFDSLNIENIQYFPTRIINEMSSQIDKGYYIANIIGKVACVDRQNSILDCYEDVDIQFIDKLVLDDNQIPLDLHIFRLSEFLPLIVISDVLKSKVEAAHITGMKLYSLDEFEL